MSAGLRPDLAAIAAMIPQGARVLDVGCGDGRLLEHLNSTKNVDGRGLELSQQNVNACVARGLAVIQGDADADLAEYPSQVFDVVILSQTIQATRNPRAVLGHLLRIGRRTVVSLPNFGHWRVRLSLGLKGRMPRTRALDYAWYDTPNIHLCTIRDFVDLCEKLGARMERAVALNASGQPIRVNAPWWFWNLFGAQAVFLLTKN